MLLVALVAIRVASALPTFSQLASRSSTAAQNFCGAPDSYSVISGTPWIVYSMNYNYQDIEGSCCTGFTGVTTASDGTQEIGWNSTWKITEVESTSNVPKGYSFVGLTENLETTIEGIESIPAKYHWVRSNETKYKGMLCLHFPLKKAVG
jgi:xyloglucan-specific endo-beta-1,4-glucanase